MTVALYIYLFGIKTRIIRTMDQQHIRNFCIIAHIDHGKSTLADRMLEITHTIEKDKLKAQFLDRMDIERERGITIKLQPVRMAWELTEVKRQNANCKVGDKFMLNLIDTPGHVDFSYEVSRSLAAVEGAILVVDATQGVEAQTISNAYLAIDQGLTVIPVVNKIDMPAAEPQAVAQALCDTFGFRMDEMLFASGKTGENVDQILNAIVEYIPYPTGDLTANPRALIFDSHYDKFKGVISHIRIIDGKMSANKRYRLLAGQTRFESLEIGQFTPDFLPTEALVAGEIGYVATGLKDVALARVGDTIGDDNGSASDALPGYKTVTPMVFAGIFPVDASEYPKLREALEKLRLNDGSLTFEPENSEALGFGFRCGFLGLLHMDVVRERLEREYDISAILSAPSVSYEIVKTDGEVLTIDSPAKFPDRTYITEIREPYALATIITTEPYLGKLIELVNERRGAVDAIDYLSHGSAHARAKITASIPLAELITDFFDVLKSISSGYASLDYEVIDVRAVEAIKLEILVAGQVVDALARIVPREHAERLGRELCDRLKDVIPRQQYEVAIQAAIGGSKGVPGKIVARETVKAFRKDVIGYLYGGDRTRKDKLLDKQKAGKKRMKMVGKVELPQEAFLAVLKQKD